MKLWIENETNVQSGYCLIRLPNNIGFGYINFLDENFTIKKYKEWYGDYTKNVLLVDDSDYYPLIVNHGSIKEVQSISYIIEYVKDRVQKGGNECFLDIEKDNFRELLNRLWDLDSNNYVDYVYEVEDYFEEMIEIYREE